MMKPAELRFDVLHESASIDRNAIALGILKIAAEEGLVYRYVPSCEHRTGSRVAPVQGSFDLRVTFHLIRLTRLLLLTRREERQQWIFSVLKAARRVPIQCQL